MARMKRVGRPRPFRCSHYTNRGIKLHQSLARIEFASSLNKSLACATCGERVKRAQGRPPRKEKAAVLDSNFRWACLVCGIIFCGIEEEFYPDGHIRDHAIYFDHPLSIRLDNPSEILCYACYLPVIVGAQQEREEKRKKQQEVTYSASQSKTGCRVKGLPNLGNTCFFNSILQNLFVMDRLRQYLLALDQPLGHVTAELKTLFINTHDDSIDTIHPNALLDFVRDNGQNFEAGTEHDSHELLIYLFNVLRLEGTVGVNEIYGGELSSILQCARCENTSTTYEQFLDLSLQVPSRTRSTEKAGVVASEDKAETDEAQISTSPSEFKKSHDSPQAKPLLLDPDDSDHAPLVTLLKSRKRRASSKGKARAKADKKDPNESISTSDPKVSIGEDVETSKETITPVATSNIDPGFGACSGDAFNDDEVCEVDNTSGLVSLRRCLELFTEPEDLPEGRCEHCSDDFQFKSGDKKASDSPITDQKKNVGSDEHDQVAVSVSSKDHTENETLSKDEVPDLQKDGAESVNKKCSGSPSHISDEKDVGRDGLNLGPDPGSSQQIGRLTKRFLIKRGPPVLTIHLKRFKQVESGDFKKIEGHLIFEETLDLTPYMDRSSMGDDEKCIYRLLGVVEHLGISLWTGHYVAYVRQGDDTWFKASDLVVEEVSLQQVLQRDAYILFFEIK